MRWNRSTFFVLIAGVLLFSLFVAGCTEGSAQETTVETVNPTVNPTEEPTEEARVPPSEETPVSTPEPTAEPTARVQAYDLELEVLKTEKWDSLGGFIPYPGKIFLIVVFKITNQGDIPYEYRPGLVWVDDENEDRWGFVDSVTFKGGVLKSPFRPMTIEPGNSAGGGLVFSVPQSTRTYPRLLLYDDEGSTVAKTVIGTVSG